MKSLWEGRLFPRACALESQSFQYFSVLLPLYVWARTKPSHTHMNGNSALHKKLLMSFIRVASELSAVTRMFIDEAACLNS